MSEITSITETLARGSQLKNLVTNTQEWLCLNNFKIKTDGDFGPATEAAVISFQQKLGLSPTGKVDLATFGHLAEPLKNLKEATLANTGDLLAAVAELAKKYLAAHPMEVGGQNMGPWVRYFMDGNQGENWPWCAGFDTLVVKQAASLLGISTSLPRTYSCDILGDWAKKNGKLIRGDSGNLSAVKPGHLFLVRKSPNDWQHTGIVIEMKPESCITIEGNTNDEGSREGYEVCQRIRGFGALDFITY